MTKLLPPDLAPAPASTAPALVSITFTQSPRLPGVRAGAMESIAIDSPHEALKHWRIAIRGASVFFISPPGWRTGKKWHEWDVLGRSTIHEVPRALVVLQWSGTPEAIDTIVKGKYDSPMFGGPVPVVKDPPLVPDPPEIDPKDMGDA